jgi:mRNA interferase RelE/StbE
MKLLYGKQFSKDLDSMRLSSEIKKRLLSQIARLKNAESLAEMKDSRKIEGYTGYYRIRIGDYRLGIKVYENQIEMIRFLHRKDIYRRVPLIIFKHVNL